MAEEARGRTAFVAVIAAGIASIVRDRLKSFKAPRDGVEAQSRAVIEQ